MAVGKWIFRVCGVTRLHFRYRLRINDVGELPLTPFGEKLFKERQAK